VWDQFDHNRFLLIYSIRVIRLNVSIHDEIGVFSLEFSIVPMVIK